MFKKIRIAVLLYILLFVAAGSYLATARSTDWDQPLWVDIYPVDADGAAITQSYIDGLDAGRFAAIEDFLSGQAQNYAIGLDRPFRLKLAPQLVQSLPPLPNAGSWFDTIVWSLKIRWLVVKLNWTSDRPTPDIVLFAVYHDPESNLALDRSGALRKGLVAIANVFASRPMRDTNGFVIAHELLHTVGATDKYLRTTNQPIFPIGYAEPEKMPLYPQTTAEIMGGRIAVSRNESTIPAGLKQVRIGPSTALEIGWIDALPAAVNN